MPSSKNSPVGTTQQHLPHGLQINALMKSKDGKCGGRVDLQYQGWKPSCPPRDWDQAMMQASLRSSWSFWKLLVPWDSRVQRWTLFNLRSLDIRPKNAMPPGMPLFPGKEFSVARSYVKRDHGRFFHLPYFWWGQFKAVLSTGHLGETVCSVTEAKRQALRNVTGLNRQWYSMGTALPMVCISVMSSCYNKYPLLKAKSATDSGLGRWLSQKNAYHFIWGPGFGYQLDV